MKINNSEDNMLWAPYYEAVLNVIGTNGQIIPLGDTVEEAGDRTTVTTVGDNQAVFTYSEAVSAFDTAPRIVGPARLPLITFNATDEEADSPDAAFWTVDDAGGANGFSIGFWANVTDTAAKRTLLSKWDITTSAEAREWELYVNTDDTLVLELYDESANVAASRATDAAITMGSLTFFTVVYDGTGGATAANGITVYSNGASIASTATNNGSYVGLENMATVVGLGHDLNTSGAAANFYSGTMIGGPLGPFFTLTQLTADQALRLYQLGRRALGV